MSTYREAQSRTADEIEKIVEMAVAKLDAKRAPKERNHVSFYVNRAKVLPKFDLGVVTILSFSIDALHTKIRAPQAWLQHSLDALKGLDGPGSYRAGFRFRSDAASEDDRKKDDECLIEFGSRSVYKPARMELFVALNALDSYELANLSTFRDRFQSLCNAAEIPIRISTDNGKLVFDAPSDLRHTVRSSYPDQVLSNELVVEFGWNSHISPEEALIRIAQAGGDGAGRPKGYWECRANRDLDKAPDPGRLYELLRENPPEFTQLSYYIRTLIPDIRTLESVIKDAKVTCASMSLADMNLPHPDHPDDPDMIYWLTLGADYRKGAFYLELAIDHSQKEYLPVVNSALGTSFR
jgi:hypothetical protein